MLGKRGRKNFILLYDLDLKRLQGNVRDLNKWDFGFF